MIIRVTWNDAAESENVKPYEADLVQRVAVGRVVDWDAEKLLIAHLWDYGDEWSEQDILAIPLNCVVDFEVMCVAT